MADLLQPTLGSKANIEVFLDTIEDQRMRDLLKHHLPDVLLAGRLASSDKKSQPSRAAFFESVAKLIRERLDEEDV